MTQHWSSAYVGVPYHDHGRTRRSGVDCWGLARLVWRARAGIRLPSFSAVSQGELATVATLLHEGIGRHGWVRVDQPRELDGVLFRRGRFDSHVGIMIDRLRMLHCDRLGNAARVERIDTGRWADCFVGFYRHESLA